MKYTVRPYEVVVHFEVEFTYAKQTSRELVVWGILRSGYL